MSHKITIAITHGDTNGIGYELIFKAFSNPELFDYCTPIVYGSEKVATYYRKALDTDLHWHLIDRAEDAREDSLNLIDVVGDQDVKIEPGRPSPEAGRMAHQALEAAAIDANAAVSFRCFSFTVATTRLSLRLWSIRAMLPNRLPKPFG